ncbi:RsmF rRNA methyltransferase first C-terminal domain-containing protein [Streptococcus macacae]|uniref:Ribosomal RNA large subunit methyltransferase J n=1 Tax=Streptococcus macacae NCTC 11558 TaxID=764298 RepID=G5JVE2_9STRE|nr:RsmB/NOP family class I SAM-dependent RNA methyltransferase [Streptococcus macacae]EHJ53199.1 ribosomal RNA large subunit methyltransferase J [Streptococcus macacae NCTC 11558]SUN78538.1 methylase [Streptococcus macacae NCTC 11558]
MLLPEKFVEKYQTILGAEAAAFFKSFEENPVSAYRINPLKGEADHFTDPIKDTPWGHYGKISGKSIEHVTGLVYSQEPAAQMVGQIAAPKPGMKVLDLAAAPGGKSTHLLSYLNNSGILISNEISKKRSKALVENIERFGARNALVTNESPKRLAAVFQHYFDLIVLDAPCSGEGMFRKDPSAIQYWHEDYPLQCAQIQKEILTEAVKMLAPGGSLVYSTCTWAPEENEEVVSWLLSKYSYLELAEIPKINGMAAGIKMPQAARMYPHCFKGEGQFAAKLQDKRPSRTVAIKPRKNQLKKEQEQLWQDFAHKHLNVKLTGFYQTFGDHLYLLPQGLPDMSQLKMARNGLHLGVFKKKRFEPSFALGLALKREEFTRFIEIDVEQFKIYVSGNSVSLSQDYPNGWYPIFIKGKGIGFAKVTGNTLKNHFPKGLRFQ